MDVYKVTLGSINRSPPYRPDLQKRKKRQRTLIQYEMISLAFFKKGDFMSRKSFAIIFVLFYFCILVDGAQ